MSVSNVCRLCLCNSDDFIELIENSPDKIRDKIEKFLYLEIEDDDPYPKSVCRLCVERLQQFNEFYLEVAQNQEILQISAPETALDQQHMIIKNEKSKSTETLAVAQTEIVKIHTVTTASQPKEQIIHLPSNFNFNDNRIVFTVQTTSDSTPTILMPNIIEGTAIIENNAVQHLRNFNFNSTAKPSTTTTLSVCSGETEAMEPVEKPVIKCDNKSQNKRRRLKSESRHKKREQEVTKPLKKKLKKREVDSKPKSKQKIKQPGTKKNNEEQSENIDNVETKKNENQIEYLPSVANYDEINYDVHDDDDDDDQDAIIDIDADYTVVDSQDDSSEDIVLDRNNEKFEGFPKCVIKDSKLIVRGKQLLEMMSQFYRLECDVCPSFKKQAEFASLQELYQHYVNEHTIKGYVICCGIKLIKPRAMAMHMARHLQPEAFQCRECDKMLTCPKILQYHIQNHLPEEQRPLACPECPRKFSYSSAYVSHLISHQPENERAAHVCDECGKTFVSAGRLTTHVNVAHMFHGQEYICHICAKQFACRSNLTYHLTTHQPKVRQVQCEKCGKWLKNKLCLRKHMIQHSAVRYNCTLCNYSALNQQCLRNHTKVQHSNIKPFSCDVCDKSFKLKNTLLYHKVQHTGIKKFKCPFCSRTFASSGNYYSHRKRMHPQELAALKLKEEEEEKRLREKVLSEKKQNV